MQPGPSAIGKPQAQTAFQQKRKGKEQLTDLSAYRPICMLDTAEKLLEKIIRPRLLTTFQAAGDLSDRQFGFRRGRFTVDALQMITEAADKAEIGNRHNWNIVFVATLDVRNAFNSVSWTRILAALENTFQVSEYLLRIMEDYFSNRVLVYDTAEGRRRREVSAGVAQGSILGPDLERVLRRHPADQVPNEAFLVCYADDIAAVFVTCNTERAQYDLNQIMRRVEKWMDGAGLRLATEKTEIIVLSRRRIPTEISFKVRIHNILAKSLLSTWG
ncbi:Retrovirus-related Pol polyprotein from type-1 retrotransposable element R1 (Fragment) [Anthophora retusa]